MKMKKVGKERRGAYIRVRKRVCAPPQAREAGGSAARARKKGQTVGLQRDSSTPSPSRP
jgi:hypothetical protein